MVPLNLILSTTESTSKAPEVVVAVCAVILLAAFFIGFKKGFKQVRWEWMTCLAAFVGFVFANKFVQNKGWNLNWFQIPGMSETAFSTFLVAFGCVAVMLVLYGLFCAAFRPRAVWRKKSKRQLQTEEELGIGDGNDEHLYWKNCGRPKFMGRFFGSIVCMVNTAVILALIVSALVLFIDTNPTYNEKWGEVLKIKIAHEALKYAKQYALDFITVCIPFFVACYGYKRGLVGSLHTVLMKAGGLLVCVLAFGLPFVTGTAGVEMSFVSSLVERCVGVVSSIPAFFQGFVAKLLAGAVLLVLFGAVFVLFDYLLGKLHTVIKNGKAIRIIDSVVSCSVYFFLGVAVIVAVWAGLYALDVFDLVKVSSMIGEGNSLSSEMLAYVKTFIDGVLAPFMKTVA